MIAAKLLEVRAEIKKLLAPFESLDKVAAQLDRDWEVIKTKIANREAVDAETLVMELRDAGVEWGPALLHMRRFLVTIPKVPKEIAERPEWAEVLRPMVSEGMRQFEGYLERKNRLRFLDNE